MICAVHKFDLRAAADPTHSSMLVYTAVWLTVVCSLSLVSLLCDSKSASRNLMHLRSAVEGPCSRTRQARCIALLTANSSRYCYHTAYLTAKAHGEVSSS